MYLVCICLGQSSCVLFTRAGAQGEFTAALSVERTLHSNIMCTTLHKSLKNFYYVNKAKKKKFVSLEKYTNLLKGEKNHFIS